MGEGSRKNEKALDPLSSVLRKHAAVVIEEPGEHGALSATDVLAWRSWFEQRKRELSSSGGRPTNPKWTLKRQIPFSKETWEELEARARVCGGSGQRIGPGQLAAFLLEDSVSSPTGRAATPTDDLDVDQDHEDESFDIQNQDFEHWEMPEPFAVAA